MFKFCAYCFVIILVFGVCLATFPIRTQDVQFYDDLLKSSNPKSNSLLSYSQQKRENVCKQIWYQDATPLYFRIDSADSELFFFRQENKVEIIEQLGNVICIMQEELYYENDQPMQRIRYLEAERASYNYNSNLFIAEDVKLFKYQLEGHTAPKKIENATCLIRATAHSVEFSLRGEKLNFTAHRMRAAFNDKENML